MSIFKIDDVLDKNKWSGSFWSLDLIKGDKKRFLQIQQNFNAIKLNKLFITFLYQNLPLCVTGVQCNMQHLREECSILANGTWKRLLIKDAISLMQFSTLILCKFNSRLPFLIVMRRLWNWKSMLMKGNWISLYIIGLSPNFEITVAGGVWPKVSLVIEDLKFEISEG